MELIKIFTEPAILIIIVSFLFCAAYTFKNYNKVRKNLDSVCIFLVSLGKKEISYRFQELDKNLSGNNFTVSAWDDFKKALIFPDKLYIASENAKGNYRSEIRSTLDSSYFFNEETLVFSNINNKLIQTMPTILTGLGPLFTFLKIAIAFGAADFSQSANIQNTLSMIIDNIQIAAFCSVLAVGFALFFIISERIMYNRMCKKQYTAIQKEFIRLFDVVTSEQFLMDLVKETKLQNAAADRMFKTLPDDFAKAIAKSLNETTAPWLENILYALNKLNETKDKNGGNDVVDKLF